MERTAVGLPVLDLFRNVPARIVPLQLTGSADQGRAGWARRLDRSQGGTDIADAGVARRPAPGRHAISTLCRRRQHGRGSRPASCRMAIVYFAASDDSQQGYVFGLARDCERGPLPGRRVRLLGERILHAKTGCGFLGETEQAHGFCEMSVHSLSVDAEIVTLFASAWEQLDGTYRAADSHSDDQMPETQREVQIILSDLLRRQRRTRSRGGDYIRSRGALRCNISGLSSATLTPITLSNTSGVIQRTRRTETTIMN